MTPQTRNRLIGIGVVLLALAGSFSAGRFSAPLKVETAVITVKGETIHEKGETVYIHDKAEAKTIVVWRDKVTAPNGTVTEKTVEKTDVKDVDKVSINANTDRTATLTESKTETKKVTLRPDWRVSLMVGASFQQPLLPISGPLVLGTMAEYRIVGGLWIGLWTLPQHGSVGAVLSFEF